MYCSVQKLAKKNKTQKYLLDIQKTEYLDNVIGIQASKLMQEKSKANSKGIFAYALLTQVREFI